MERDIVHIRPYAMPPAYRLMVGTIYPFDGCLFQKDKELPWMEYEVLGVKWADEMVINIKTREVKHPMIKYLVMHPSLMKPKWTRPVAVKEINFEQKN